MEAGLAAGLNTVNQILSAGIAITAFSLLLYALSFNLRERVSRSFAMILACMVVIFTAKSIGSTVENPGFLTFWLRLQWVGIIPLPAAYLHFSDALLSTTGRPSRGRRLWAVRLTYLFSVFLLVALLLGILVGPLVPDAYPAPYLRANIFTELFTLYYAGIILVAWVNFARAYSRTTTPTSRRRMLYLLAGATAPALGSYPYLIFGYEFAAAVPGLFWVLVTISNFLVGTLIVVMAYSVAFFGVPWPDRVVRSRLFKWLMRGAVTASVTLTLTTLVRRAGAAFGTVYTALVPIVMVGVILLMEYLITLLSPLWDRVLFYGKDRDDLMLLHNLDDRLLTRNDLRQFLELVLSSVCDRLQVKTAFVAALNGNGLELVVKTGENRFMEDQTMSTAMLETVSVQHEDEELFLWGDYLLMPLKPEEDDNQPAGLVGILGFSRPENREIDEEQIGALNFLARRAAMALQDRHLQLQVVQSLQELNPQIEIIQRLRA
ncbi:MAG TPA: histidine kinase N-terminal 7TM domain-containing protein, partial [Anaerolineaceae bacterium]